MVWGIIAAVIAVVASAGVYYQQKKMEAQAAKQAQEAKAVQVSGHDSNRGLYTVYGQTLVGSTVVWKTVTDKEARITQSGFTTISAATGSQLTTNKDHKNNRWLYRAVTLCNGPVTEITNVTIDDEGYRSPRFTNKTTKHFATTYSVGPTAGQNFSALRNAYASDFSTWASDAVGKGVAYAIERLYLHKDKPAYQGEPQTRYRVKGRALYDPRKDSTSSAYDSNLGTSSHRADTATTWEYSDNPVLALLDYMRSGEYGRGLDLSVIDIDSIAVSADKCDVLVDIPQRLANDTGSVVTYYDPETGEVYVVTVNGDYPYYRADQQTTGVNANKQRRFRINMAVDPSKEILDNIQEILNVFRGNLSYANGKYFVHMADVASPVLTLNDDDIIGGLKIANGDRSQRMNRATVKFINQAKQYKTDQVSWPSLDSNEDGGLYATYLTQDEDEKLHRTFTIKGCTDFYQAQDTAEFLVRDSRSNLSVSGTFGSRCFGLIPGDVVALDYDSSGFSGKYFRVIQTQVDLVSMNVGLQLKEYDSSVYTWNTSRGNEPLGLSWQEEVVNADPTNLTIGTITTNTTTRSDGSASQTLTIPFSDVPEAAQYVEIGVATNNTTEYETHLVFDTENQTQAEIPIARDNQTYAVRARYFATNSYGTLMPSAYTETTHAVASLSGTKLDGIATGATQNTGALADLDTVDTAQIDNDAITVAKLDTSLESTNYQAGVSGWKLTKAGVFEAGSGTFRGDVTATSITLESGVTLGSSDLDQTTQDSLALADSALQDADTSVNLELTNGSVGGITINSASVESTNFSAGVSGFKLESNGTFEVGDGTFRGAITATSITLDGTTIAGNQLDQTTQDSLGLADSAIQDEDTGLDLGITAGSIAGVTINSTTLYQGTGAFNNSNTGFYLDDQGQFSLKDKLTFDGTDLSVSGSVTASAFTLSSGATLTDTDDLIANTNNNAFFRYETTAANDAVVQPTDTQFNAAFGRSPRTRDVVIVVNTTSDPDVSAAYVYNGSSWDAKNDFFTGDVIVDGTITADHLSVNSLEAISADMGSITAGSLDINSGAFAVTSAGVMSATGATVSGAITATSLTLSDITIPKTDLDTGVQTSLDDADSALQDADTGVNLGITDGSVGGINIDSDKLYAGTGTWANANTGFYLDDGGKFSLKDKLFFDPTNNTLTVDGNITADVITAKQNLVVLGDLQASSVATGSITRAMLSQDALDEIFGSLASSVGGSNGDFKDGSGTFTTSGGSLTLGTSSDKFDHGSSNVDVEFNINTFFYTTTNYTQAQAQATLTFEATADGTFNDLNSADKTHTLQFFEYDLSSYYGYTYLVYHLNTAITKTFTSGPGSDIANNVELQFRISASSVGSAFTGQTIPFDVAANEGVTGVTSTGGNADTLDNLDSTKFLRSDVDDTFDGDLTITGQLILQGSIDQYNVTDLEVTDKTITVNSGNTQALSDGAGLIVDRGTAADASLTWDETNDQFKFTDTVEFANGIAFKDIGGQSIDHAKIFFGTFPNPAGSLSTSSVIDDFGVDGYGMILQSGGAFGDVGGIKITDDGVAVFGAGDEGVFVVVNEDANTTDFKIGNKGAVEITPQSTSDASLRVNRNLDGNRISLSYQNHGFSRGEIGQVYSDNTGKTRIWLGSNLFSTDSLNHSGPRQDSTGVASWLAVTDSIDDEFAVKRIAPSGGTTLNDALVINSSLNSTFYGSIIFGSNGKVLEIADAAIQWYSLVDSAYKSAAFRAADYTFKNGGNTPIFTIGSSGNTAIAGTLNSGAITTGGQLHLAGGNYEGLIKFGTQAAWHTGIRQHDDGDAEMRIWAKHANGMIFLATGYDGEPASISRPTDGLAIQSNNLGIGNFSAADPAAKLHVKTTSDFQMLLDGDTSAWAGIKFQDVNDSDYLWYHGSTDTWSFGGNGSSQNSEKRLHVEGGVSIGAALRQTTVATNGLTVEGDIVAGSGILTVKPTSGSGGQIGLGDWSNTNPIGISEGLWNTVASDNDFITIYARNSFNIRGYSGGTTQWLGLTNTALTLTQAQTFYSGAHTIYTQASTLEGINLVANVSSTNQNSDSPKIQFNGEYQSNGPYIQGDNTGSYGYKSLRFYTNRNSGTDYTTAPTATLTLDSAGNAQFTGEIGGASGYVSGKFAVKSTSVHGTYDFYNNGTTYLNGSTIIDDALNLIGTNGKLEINGTTVIDNDRNLTSIGTVTASNIVLSSNQPISLYHGGTGTYEFTAIYDAQNDTSGNELNGLFIERGRLGNSSSAEVRHFVVGARGGSKQLVVDGTGNTDIYGDLYLHKGANGGLIQFGGSGSGDYLRLADRATGNNLLELYQDSGLKFGIDGQSGDTYVKGSLRAAEGGIYGNMNGNWHTDNALRGGNFSADIANDTTVLKLFPASDKDEAGNNRAANDYNTGIAFMHLDPAIWGSAYQGAQAWIGMRFHDGSGQERDFLTFATNNSATAGTFPIERMAISPEGYVGIGEADPAELLHLTATTPVLRMEGGSRSYQQYVSGSSFYIRDVTAQANRLILDSSGNLDITDGDLEINGVTRIANNGNATLGTISSGTISSGTISSSNIGIGDTALSFGSGVSTLLLQGTAANNRAGAVYFREQDGTATTALYSTNGSDGYGTVLGAYQGSIKFGIGGITSSNIALTIDTSKNATFQGNVGVGATSSIKFEVVETIANWTGSFKNYTAGAYGLRVDLSGSSGDAFAFATYTATNTGFFVKNDGRIGAGRTDPTAKLDIKRAYSSSQRMLSIQNHYTGSADQNGTSYDTVVISQEDVPCIRLVERPNNQHFTFSVGNENSNSAVIKATGKIVLSSGQGANSPGYSYSGEQALVVDTGNKVGVYVNSPTNRFHVKYNVNATIANLAEVDDYAAVRIGNFRADGDHNLYIGYMASNSVGLQARTSTASGTAQNILINPYGGGVGIGTTSSGSSGGLLVDNDIKTNSRIGVGSTGTAGSPAVYRNGDTDTGMYWAGTNELGFSTAGQLRLRIEANGTVKVGEYTGATEFMFRAAQNSTSTIRFNDNNDTEGTYIASVGQLHGGDIKFGARWDDDEDKMIIRTRQSSAGGAYDVRVGIGTVNPSNTLEVNGGTTIGGQLRVNTSNWPTTTIGDSGGRHIFGGSSEPTVILWNEATPAANNYSTLFIGSKSANSATTFGGGFIRGGIENTSDSDGFLKFFVSYSANSNFQALHIDSDGNFNANTVSYNAGRRFVFRNGNNAVPVAYDTFVVTSSDVPCISIVETNGNNSQSAEQQLKLAVGDNDAVISTSSTVGGGLHLRVARATSQPGYSETQGKAGVHIQNDGAVNIGGTSGVKTTIKNTLNLEGWATTGGQSRDTAIYIGRDGTATSSEYFTMGFKTTARSGEQIHPTNGPYNGGPALYIECGSTEAGGICLDQDSVHVYGSSDSGSTFRVIDKDSDVVTFEMLQTSWNGVFRGNVIAYGSMSSISDRRIKTDIKPIDSVLDKINELGVYSYKKITAPHDREEIGVMAQEIQEQFPELVNETEVSDPSEVNGLESILTVDYEHLTAVLLKGMQEQQQQINHLTKIIEEMKNGND